MLSGISTALASTLAWSTHSPPRVKYNTISRLATYSCLLFALRTVEPLTIAVVAQLYYQYTSSIHLLTMALASTSADVDIEYKSASQREQFLLPTNRSVAGVKIAEDERTFYSICAKRHLIHSDIISHSLLPRDRILPVQLSITSAPFSDLYYPPSFPYRLHCSCDY